MSDTTSYTMFCFASESPWLYNCCVSFRQALFKLLHLHEVPGDRNDPPMGWNSDDETDFEDQQYSPPSPMAYYPGSHNPELNPLARLMADLPDFNDVDTRALDDALRGLPVPDLCSPPPGLSSKDARKVHHILYIQIVYDIVCDIVYDVLH